MIDMDGKPMEIPPWTTTSEGAATVITGMTIHRPGPGSREGSVVADRSEPLNLVSLIHCAVRRSKTSLQDGQTYDPMVAYGQSNAARVMFVKRLGKKLKATNITLAAFDWPYATMGSYV
jgi:NAD(P)-dependent dehydrogenase (short-subunit alcohol dehydrogenase family)